MSECDNLLLSLNVFCVLFKILFRKLKSLIDQFNTLIEKRKIGKQ